MELAKLLVELAILAASLAAYTWWATAYHGVAPDTAQALLNDICSLAGMPANTTIEATYTLPQTVEVGPGTLATSEALAPQCASISYNGTHYTYTPPISTQQPTFTLKGTVKLKLTRTTDGVALEPQKP